RGRRARAGDGRSSDEESDATGWTGGRGRTGWTGGRTGRIGSTDFPSCPSRPSRLSCPLLLRRRRRRHGLEHVLLPGPDVRLLARHLDLDLATALGRIRILRVVAQHVIVARLRVDALQRLAEVVLVDDRETACFLRDDAETVLRLPDVFGPLLRIDLFVDV